MVVTVEGKATDKQAGSGRQSKRFIYLKKKKNDYDLCSKSRHIIFSGFVITERNATVV